MTRNMLILKSSPRKLGNSSVLANRAGAGAEAAGAVVESFDLQTMDLHPCRGCDGCRKTGVCVIKDDMHLIYPKALATDAVLLASPIYWFTYNAQLKTCIDRWYALWNAHPDVFKNKPVGVILTYGDTDLYTSGGINAIHSFESMFKFLGADIAGWVYGSLSDIGDAQKQPELMEKAYQLGQKLGRTAEES